MALKSHVKLCYSLFGSNIIRKQTDKSKFYEGITEVTGFVTVH